MSEEFDKAEQEILEVERRLVARVHRMDQNWHELRSATRKKYAFPAMVAAAAVGALAVGAAVRRNQRPVPSLRWPSRTEEKTTLMAKLLAVASLLSTLRRLPIAPLLGPAMEWLRQRRTGTDMKSRASPISRQRRPL
jgi:hypothetical protein